MTPRENALIAYRHGIPHYIPCMYSDMLLVKPNLALDRYCGHESGYDAFGCHWTYDANLDAAIPTPGRYLFTEIPEWHKKLMIPDLEAYDWEKLAEVDMKTNIIGAMAGNGQTPDEQEKSNAGKLKVAMLLQGMFERLHSCMGFENALTALMEDPDECAAFFSAIADYKIAEIQKIAKYYPVDVINAHDDYGMANGLFMRPELWRKLLKPQLKRIVEATHDCGLIYQHHSCGYIEPLLPDFVEIGVDAIDTLQACNTRLPELKRQYGDRITFCGGFDNQHVLDVLDATPEAIKAEYRRVIDSLAPGGSYVIYPIGATFAFVKPFMQEHFQYGMGFYQRASQN